MADRSIAVAPAPGRMGVDFEERVDFGRLREYRLSRAKAALEASDLGALLVFDKTHGNAAAKIQSPRRRNACK